MSSFNSLFLEPPLVLFSIDCRAGSLPLWEKATGYAINVLSENQKDISNRFARPHSNKWEGISFQPGASDAAVLAGVVAVFECEPWARRPAGDHILFIAKVTRFRSFADRQPLVFGKGRYAALQMTEIAAPLWPLDIHTLYSAQVLTQQMYAQVIVALRELAGGGLIMLPSSVHDFADPQLRHLIEKTQ